MSDIGSVLRTLTIFTFAAVCEIGGGWLIWKSLREGKPAWWSLAGAILLILFGILPTLQPSNFGRVFAAYGGFFIVMSLLWGWGFDGNRPDLGDLIGCSVALVGACVIMFWPRSFDNETTIETMGKMTRTSSFEIVGKTQPVPGRVGTISAIARVPVTEVMVAPGDRVTIGQVLVRLGARETDLQAKRLALAELQAQLTRRQSKSPAQEQEESLRILEDARIETQKARKTLEGFEALWPKGEVSEQRYRKSRSALALCEADERVAAARLDRLIKQPVDLEIAELEACIAAAKTAVKVAELESEQSAVMAPIAGVVSRLDVNPGTVAKPGATAWGEVLDLSEIDVRCNLTPHQAHDVAIGDSVEISQQGSHTEWTGRIVFIGVAADQHTGLVPVLVRLKDAGVRLRCYVEVKAQFGASSEETLPFRNGEKSRTAWAVRQ